MIYVVDVQSVLVTAVLVLRGLIIAYLVPLAY